MNGRRHYVFLFIFLCYQLSNFAQSKTLKIGIDPNYPPFSTINDKETTGFDVDIAKSLCEYLKYNCTIVPTNFDELIPNIESGKIDVIISSMNDIDSRKERVSFSKKYYNIPTRMVKLKDADFDFKSKYIHDKKIGVQIGSTADEHLPFLFGKIAKISRYVKTEDLYNDLSIGNLNFIMGDSIALEDGFLKTKDGKNFEFFGPKLFDKKFYGTGAAIAVKKGNAKLANEFSHAIEHIRKNGKYQEISYKYFGKDIYGY